MRVIVISGKAQNGKDTTAGFLKEALEADGYSVLIAHYGDLVKYVSALTVPPNIVRIGSTRQR